MPDLDVLLTLPADTYVDTTDASTDHSNAVKAPLNPDTAWLVRWPLGGIPDDAKATGWTLTLTAAADFDGTVGLALHRLAEPFTMDSTATLPAFKSDAPATFSGALAAGDTVALDVSTLVQAVIDSPGSDYGWALVRTDAGTAGSIWTSKAPTPASGTDVVPTLAGDWTVSPDAPESLWPAGGAVSVSKPVVRGVFDSDLSAVQVQIASSTTGWTAASGFPSPTFDSGSRAATDPSLDLSTTAYAGLSNTHTAAYWTMRAQDSSGWSQWAAPVSMALYLPPTVAVTSSPVASEVSPTFTFTSTTTMDAYQVVVYERGTTDVFEDSGRLVGSGTSGSYTMATILPDSSPYTVEVRVWDTVADRQATPGAAVYGSATQDFAYADDQGIAPPDDVIASQVGGSPWVDLFVTLHAEPQEIIAIVDGFHQGRYKPSDLDPPASGEGTLTYRIRLWDLQPYTAHVVGAKRVDHHQTSAGVFYALDAMSVKGAWVADLDTGETVYLGNNSISVSVEDQVGVLTALGASYPIQQKVAAGSLSGTLSGTIDDRYDTTATEWHRALRAIAHGKGSNVRIAWANLSFPAAIRNVVGAEPKLNTSAFAKKVSIDFSQTGKSSLIDEPADPGSQTVSTYDFEEGTDGAAITIGTAPYWTAKQGSPVYAAAAAIHGSMGYDNGAGGSSLTGPIACPSINQFYIAYPSKSGTWSTGTATICQVEDVNGNTIFDLGPRTNGLYVLNDALGNTLAMGTQKREPFDGSLVTRIEVLVTWDGTNATGIFKIFYAAESSVPDEQFSGTVVAAEPFQITVNNNAARVRAYVDTVQVASDASAWLAAFAPDDTPTHLFSWLGGTTQTSALVNSILDPLLDPGKSVDLARSTSSTMSSPTLVGAQTVRADGTVQHSVTGLAAKTDYYFQLHYNGAAFGRVLHVKTDPTSTANWTRDIIPASCLGNFAGGKTPDAALQDIITVGLPAEWWWLGDEYWGQNIAYTDPYTSDIAKQANWQTQFTALRAIAEQTNLRARTISDHNLFDNGDDAPSNGYDPLTKSGPQHIFGSLEPVREIQAFQAMTPVRVYGDTRTPRKFRSYYSDLLVDGSGNPLIRVVTSDMRTPERNNSDDTDGPTKSLWGVAQENWLYGVGGALDVPAACLVIFVNETSWWRNTGSLRASDKPAAYPDAQTRFMARLNGTGEFAGMNDLIGAGKFLWIGGDRHYCGYQSAASNPDGFPQIISSGIQKNWLALQDGEAMDWITPVPASSTDPDQAVAQYTRLSLSYTSSTHVLTMSIRARYVADTSGDPSGWVFSDLPSGGPTVLTWTLT